jgi:hypothetical protein
LLSIWNMPVFTHYNLLCLLFAYISFRRRKVYIDWGNRLQFVEIIQTFLKLNNLNVNSFYLCVNIFFCKSWLRVDVADAMRPFDFIIIWNTKRLNISLCLYSIFLLPRSLNSFIRGSVSFLSRQCIFKVWSTISQGMEV